MIDFHTHNSTDGTPPINPKDLLGFPIFTTVPTHTAIEGTPVFVVNGGNYYLYVMLNKTWRGVQLPL